MTLAMSEEQFTTVSMGVCLTILIVFMGFIIWDLGRKSKAGKFGTAVLFLVLGFGVSGFVFKNILVEFMERGH
jgi:uncharacterized membrane protein YwaF